jgi:DNA replication protein DnaC
MTVRRIGSQLPYHDEFDELVKDSIADYQNQYLTNIGMSPKLIDSSLERIPKEIISIIPKPLSGFGLIGVSGGGKSSAIAAKIKQLVNIKLYTNMEEIESYLYDMEVNMSSDYDEIDGLTIHDDCKVGLAYQKFNWVNWPSAFEEIQQNSRTENQYLKREYTPEAMKECEFLILDDLGRERFPNSKFVPYAVAQLELIIDHRNGHNKPIIWTSNVEAETLIEMYGIPTYSRLIQDNPPSDWLKLRNLRV